MIPRLAETSRRSWRFSGFRTTVCFQSCNKIFPARFLWGHRVYGLSDSPFTLNFHHDGRSINNTILDGDQPVSSEYVSRLPSAPAMTAAIWSSVSSGRMLCLPSNSDTYRARCFTLMW